MATPRGKFDSNDAKSVIISLLLAILSAAVTWAMADGMDLLQQGEWIPAALFPLVFAILSALQAWLSDTRPPSGTPTKS